MKFPLPPLHALGSELTEVCSPYPGHWHTKVGKTKVIQRKKKKREEKKVSTSIQQRGHLGHCMVRHEDNTVLLQNTEYSNKNGSLLSEKQIMKTMLLNQLIQNPT